MRALYADLEHGCGGPVGLEGGLKRAAGGPDQLERQRETDLRVEELQRVGALACGRRHRSGLDDLDAREAAAVARAHLMVQLVNRAVEGGVAVLLRVWVG
eukprot:360117-Chlamydomonas_euryale.AAC.13